jgi:hypothetical protein
LAVTVVKYPKGIKKFLDGDIDLLVDTIKAAVCTTSYTPATTHEFVSDLTNELSGGGYARVTLTGKTTTAGTDTAFDCGDITFPTLTATNAGYVAIFKDTGADATSPLICYINFGGGQSPANQDLIVALDAAGLFKI